MPDTVQRPKGRFWPCPYCHGRLFDGDLECSACDGTGDGRVYMAYKRSEAARTCTQRRRRMPMPEHAVNFEDWQVRAAKDRRLRQIRLPVKPQPCPPDHITRIECHNLKPGQWGFCDENLSYRAPYAPGDVLRVRETWVLIDNSEFYAPDHPKYRYYEYRADSGAPYPGGWLADEARGNPEAPKWQPSSRMPKEASRLSFTVVAIRVEQAHEMREADVEACGMGDATVWTLGLYAECWDIHYDPRHPWASNPWVWVVDLEEVKRE